MLLRVYRDFQEASWVAYLSLSFSLLLQDVHDKIVHAWRVRSHGSYLRFFPMRHYVRRKGYELLSHAANSLIEEEIRTKRSGTWAATCSSPSLPRSGVHELPLCASHYDLFRKFGYHGERIRHSLAHRGSIVLHCWGKGVVITAPLCRIVSIDDEDLFRDIVNTHLQSRGFRSLYLTRQTVSSIS